MKVTRIIHKTENLTPSREMWELNCDCGWEVPEWRTVARRDTLEEAIAAAEEKGYKMNESDKDLTTYKKEEFRTMDEDENYVFDSYSRVLWRIIHYYIFD